MAELAQCRRKFALLIAPVFALAVVSSLAPSTGAYSQEDLGIGVEVEVAGAGDCLNVRESFGLSSPVLECVVDGTRARVSAGPIPWESETWWELAGRGWVAGRFLRVTGPREPDLLAMSGSRPWLPGLIAYVALDRNLWVGRPDGSWARQLTDDADPLNESDRSRIYYDGFRWSTDGRYLLYGRSDASSSSGADNFSGQSSLWVYDSVTGVQRVIPNNPGREFHSPYWLDGANLAVVEAKDEFHGCFVDSFADQVLIVLNVETGERYELIHPRSPRVFIAAVGPLSPDGATLAYSEFQYCEGVGPVCSVRLSEHTSSCLGENGWSSRGWISSSELRLFDDPYSLGSNRELRPDIAFNVATGVIRPAEAPDVIVAYTEDERLEINRANGDITRNGALVFHVPVQHETGLPRLHVVAPRGDAFLFNIDGDTRVGMTDGSNRSWSVVQGDGRNFLNAAWQPAVLPPVLLVHGCGGGLATWTDTGWFADAVEVGQLQYGSSGGQLYRGDWTRFHGSSVYAIDYNGSAGTLAELSSLIPAALDLVRSENGDTPVFIATHSMGGVLTQFYLADLASSGPYRDDVAGAYLVAPPTRGAWAANWSPDGWVCPQSGALEVGSDELRALESNPPVGAPITITSGTAIWVPFVGDTDGIVAYDDIAPLGVDVPLLREDNGIHVDPPALPNFLTGLCETIPPTREPQQRCVNELRIESVIAAMLQTYVERLEQ